jgi:hypothetical protein
MVEWEGHGGWFRWSTPIGRYVIAEVKDLGSTGVWWIAEGPRSKRIGDKHPTRPDAAKACIDHATGVWRDLGRELGWPDEAAVERAWETLYDRGVEYSGDLPVITRAALTAAMGGE